MGIHIDVLPKENSQFARSWDYVRHAGDRDFVGLCEVLQHQDVARYPGDQEFRPLGFSQWRERVASWDNATRFISLLDALEADPELYVSVSW